MKMFTLSAACNVLRETLLNINFLFEAFCIFTIPNVISNIDLSVSRRTYEGSNTKSRILSLMVIYTFIVHSRLDGSTNLNCSHYFILAVFYSSNCICNC